MENDNLLTRNPGPSVSSSSRAEDTIDGLDSTLGYYGAVSNNTASRCLLPSNEDTQPSSGDTREIDEIGRILPDLNAYQQKKTLAQGMMDLALLSANATQLRFVLESQKSHPYFYVSVICIVVSLCFQIAVGVGLILNCRYNIKNQTHICPANRVNNFTVIGIFIITVINVFVSAFAVSEVPVGKQ